MAAIRAAFEALRLRHRVLAERSWLRVWRTRDVYPAALSTVQCRLSGDRPVARHGAERATATSRRTAHALRGRPDVFAAGRLLGGERDHERHAGLSGTALGKLPAQYPGGHAPDESSRLRGQFFHLAATGRAGRSALLF